MHHYRAFTLIELSIVLVIIGLIVGGVLVGQDLIRGAQIRKTSSIMQQTKSALFTFRVKYNCEAGDCDFSIFDNSVTHNGNGNKNYEGVEAQYIDDHLNAAELLPKEITFGLGPLVATLNSGYVTTGPRVYIANYDPVLFHGAFVFPNHSSASNTHGLMLTGDIETRNKIRELDTYYDDANAFSGRILADDTLAANANSCLDSDGTYETSDTITNTNVCTYFIGADALQK